MTRRFRVSLLLTTPILAFVIGQPVHHLLPEGALNWLELALATPVVP